MPIYTYKAKDSSKCCIKCCEELEVLQNVNDNPLEKCPFCGAEVEKVISAFSLGFSKTTLDRRAKEKGFHKLKRVDKNKYEKVY